MSGVFEVLKALAFNFPVTNDLENYFV